MRVMPKRKLRKPLKSQLLGRMTDTDTTRSKMFEIKNSQIFDNEDSTVRNKNLVGRHMLKPNLRNSLNVSSLNKFLQARNNRDKQEFSSLS